jgi:hypothetical protein
MFCTTTPLLLDPVGYITTLFANGSSIWLATSWVMGVVKFALGKTIVVMGKEFLFTKVTLIVPEVDT